MVLGPRRSHGNGPRGIRRAGGVRAHASADRHRYRGLALYGVDGTTVRTLDSAENRAHFGGQSGGDRGASGYPQARVVTLMALRSHLLAAARFGPYAVGETTMAEELWPELPDDSLCIVDREFLAVRCLSAIEDQDQPPLDDARQ